MKKNVIALALLFISLLTKAQGEAGGGDIFAGNLKIYVVVAVLAIILGVIFFYLFSLESRLKKLEGQK